MRFPVVAACLALAVGVAACGSDEDAGSGDSAKTNTADTTGSTAPVKIALSVPAADHGWLAAVAKDARDVAKGMKGVELTVNDSATDSAGQADQIETMINDKPDALVVLPNEGEALTPVAQKATAAGIPVINVDREFSTPGAFRTWIGGDNYGIGWQAGNYFADELKCKGNVVEIQGLAGISVTELRTKGFADAIKRRCQDGIKIVAQQPGDFNPDKGLSVMENILQGQKSIDGVYTHDDDMAEGVIAAIENANREGDMFLTGAGGSEAIMKRIEAGGLVRATFLYNPTMAASAVKLAALIARDEGMKDLTEPEVPSRIQVPATTVTKDNVADHKGLAY
ncbi:MAG TPA: substrate-binding domain-containing protein [Solirubrobacteraceae bacterium]|nr:substrate-binding domain-containing protein [Solirubrobacteraceae bacterium]